MKKKNHLHTSVAIFRCKVTVIAINGISWLSGYFVCFYYRSFLLHKCSVWERKTNERKTLRIWRCIFNACCDEAMIFVHSLFQHDDDGNFRGFRPKRCYCVQLPIWLQWEPSLSFANAAIVIWRTIHLRSLDSLHTERFPSVTLSRFLFK